MEMYCPKCFGPLELVDERYARCKIHGGRYELRCDRWVEAPQDAAGQPAESRADAAATRESPAPAAIAASPAALPAAVAGGPSGEGGAAQNITGECPSCHKRYVIAAKFAGRQGHCRGCDAYFSIPAASVAVDPLTAYLDALPPRRELDVDCTNHAGVRAAVRCRLCGAPVCATCAFTFPRDLQTCPACASRPAGVISGPRTNYLIGSYACGALAMLFAVAYFAAAALGAHHFTPGMPAILVLCFFAVLAASIVGSSLSSAARLTGRPTPVWIWIAMVWNLLYAVGFVVLGFVGALMRR